MKKGMFGKDIQKDVAGETTILPYFLCSGIFFILGVIISIPFFKKKKNVIGVVIIVLSIILTVVVGGILIEQIGDEYRRKELSYEITISTNTTDEYFLIVPVLDNYDLKSNIEITSGYGIIGFTSVNVTPVLNSIEGLTINSNENVTISGDYVGTGSGDLSLLESEEVLIEVNNEQHLEEVNFYWVWCEKSHNQNITIQIESVAKHFNPRHSWYSNEIILSNGWNKVPVGYGLVMS